MTEQLTQHTEYTMPDAGQDEAQAGIKIARRNINNLRHVDDTTLMAESEGNIRPPNLSPKNLVCRSRNNS